ncbi:DUF1045 domain-containing protein [Pseudooceanicola sp. LIPI14-2-Ac024]|uniref:DUF1045 domain-containing protein n=1 Tax=Pseudooceanicola sp. LIPI14-2-Ac024 TaxID=3344875 RepID=UPI0035D13209
MPPFERYALYYLCPPGPLADFGASWLGWDVAKGVSVPHPEVAGLPRPVEDITATPRKYGFHGTIKPPFRLAEDRSFAALEAEATALCARLAPVTLEGLALTPLGHFLALTPAGDAADLACLAAACVEGLDDFRRPAGEAELARRRSRGLSPRQEANLTRWGYPYVMDDFRFHMTLSGRLSAEDLAATAAALDPVVTPLLSAPYEITEMALVGADAEDRFHLVKRLPLKG